MGYLALLLVITWVHDVPHGVTNDEWDALVRRVDATPLPFPGAAAQSRIKWDDAGHVVMLRLDGMQLSKDEFRLLARFQHLERLGLSHSNVTDSDLRHLEGLEHLRVLTLNRTAITDRAVSSIKKLKALDTLCLGDVDVTPGAVEELKEHFPKLQLGYARKRR